MLRLRNRLPALLRAASPLPAPIHPRPCCILSTTTSPSPAPFSVEDYLVASCGLAPTQACEVSKKLSRELLSTGSKRPLDELSYSRLNSASNPDAIIALLAGAGLSRADIAAVVSADPLLLRAYAKKIAPRLLGLRDRVGLSPPQIVRFLLVGPHVRTRSGVVPKLEFFISFYGSFEQVLVVLRRNSRLLSASIERSVKPNIALLRHRGVRDIAQLCSKGPTAA
ncbi:unnamed protein product [Miscanthus lutarioriparius]|uniref:Uncharacterized protein n=1 Tax=Miscanthus lutarioriparius TaxID=422564 RepID=A0A811SIM7_9POAL|nr:unnamed protein product [Miscanthus lutarioriparius]